MGKLTVESGLAMLGLIATQSCSPARPTQSPEVTLPPTVTPVEVIPTANADARAVDLLKKSYTWQAGDTFVIETDGHGGVHAAHHFDSGASRLANITELGQERLYLTWFDEQGQNIILNLEGYSGFSQAAGINLIEQDRKELNRGIRIGLGLVGVGADYTVLYRDGDLKLTDGVTKEDYTNSFLGSLYAGSGSRFFDPEVVITNGYLDRVSMAGGPDIPVHRSFHQLIFHSSDWMSVFGW